MLVAVRLPAFQKRAKRRLTAHPKFFLFDAGVYRAIRPRGPLDAPEEIDGPAFETLLMQELRAHVAYRGWDDGLYYWRTITRRHGAPWCMRVQNVSATVRLTWCRSKNS